MTRLDFAAALTVSELLAAPVSQALSQLPIELSSRIEAAEIDAGLADTAAFCEHYGQALEASANCLIVAGRRGDTVSYAACIVLATTRADVNGVVRKLLGARRASFAPTEEAVALTGMEFGGITPIGLPEDWRILVDSRVVPVPRAIIGAGIRGAKLFLPGEALAALPRVEVIEGLAL